MARHGRFHDALSLPRRAVVGAARRAAQALSPTGARGARSDRRTARAGARLRTAGGAVAARIPRSYRRQHDRDQTPERGAQRRSPRDDRSEEHTSELKSLMRTSYAGFCLKKQKITSITTTSQFTIDILMV